MKYWDIDIGEDDSAASPWSAGKSTEQVSEHRPEIGHRACINHLALSRSGTSLVSVSDDKKCFLWDMETFHHTRSFKLSTGASFKCCAFLPSEKTFITASDDGFIWLWDIRTAKQVSQVASHTGPATSCSLNADGNTVISGGWDNVVNVSDIRSNSVRAIRGHTDWILTTAHASAGDVCASSGWDQTIRVWSSSALTRKHVINGHMDTITSLAVSPDSRYLASASYDSTVKLWNLTSGTAESTFPGHDGHVNKVAFAATSPAILFSAGEDGVVKLWDVARKQMKNEFMCRGPATACDAVVKGDYNGELMMVYGDSIGNIYTARLHQGRQ